MNYADFLNAKRIVDPPTGFEPNGSINPALFDFQKDVVRWALRRGRACLFEDCGLGKTPQQLEWANRVVEKTGKNVLILCPLAVARQTEREGKKFGIEVREVPSSDDVKPGISVTNYEKLHRFDPSAFTGIVLDESSILKSYDGKTRTEILNCFSRTPYRLACTATPAPNDLMELGNHSEFVGAMSRSEMLSMFFVHDGGDTSKWRLKGHAESDFWRWICSWAVNIRKPSDLGYADENFKLPELHIEEHVVQASHSMDGFLFALPASSLEERRNARSVTIHERAQVAAELANATDDPWLVWCNLNEESSVLRKLIKGAVEVRGSDSQEHKENSMRGFSDGSIRCLITKPTIAGFGMNWQHCARMAFVGLSDSYEQFYQATRRCWRFGQTREVYSHVIISSIEGAVVANIKRKEAEASRLAREMSVHMAEITSRELRGTFRTQTAYEPKTRMEIPQWMKN